MAKKKSLSKLEAIKSIQSNTLTREDIERLRAIPKENDIIGLRIPLAFELLLQSTCLPVGIVIELLGMPGSYKSTLAYEIGRQITAFGGWSEFLLTEGKVSPKLLDSIIGYQGIDYPEGHEAYFLWNSNDMQDWQKYLLRRIKLIQEAVERSRKDGVGMEAPVHFMVDSIMGQNLVETDQKVEAEGGPARGFALEAGSLTKYLKTVQADISEHPMILTLINHNKVDPSETPYQAPTKKSPGGKQVKFQATYRIELEKVGKAKLQPIAGGDSPGMYRRIHTLKLSLMKSSLGEEAFSIVLPYERFERRSSAGGIQEIGRFRWNEAIVGFLLEQVHNNQKTGKGDKQSMRDRLDAVVHFRNIRGDKYESKTFGATKESPMSSSQLGAAIQADEKICEEIRDMFSVARYDIWDTRQDFYEVRKLKKERMIERLFNVPQNTKRGR